MTRHTWTSLKIQLEQYHKYLIYYYCSSSFFRVKKKKKLHGMTEEYVLLNVFPVLVIAPHWSLKIRADLVIYLKTETIMRLFLVLSHIFIQYLGYFIQICNITFCPWIYSANRYINSSSCSWNCFSLGLCPVIVWTWLLCTQWENWVIHNSDTY